MKKYKLDNDFSKTEVFNEISFLRELKMCENIAQLYAVYLHTDNLKNIEEICLVMKYAKDGTLYK